MKLSKNYIPSKNYRMIKLLKKTFTFDIPVTSNGNVYLLYDYNQTQIIEIERNGIIDIDYICEILQREF